MVKPQTHKLMYYHDKTVVFLNGKFIKAKEARFSLFSQTLHYGNGVFEGIRAYPTPQGVRMFKAKEHFQRLIFSAEKMLIPFDYTPDELESITYSVLEQNELTDAYIRPMIFMNETMGLTPGNESNLFIAAWKWAKYLGDKLLNVGVSVYERPNPKAFPIEAKINGIYTNSILATNEAKKRGFDEALMLDNQGFVAEAPGANIFYEKDGQLFTPPRGNIMPGITRQTVIELAQKKRIPVHEKFFTVAELQAADAAFFTGTATEIAGIGSVDGKAFSMDYKHTRSYEIAEAYMELVRSAEGIFSPQIST